MQSNTKIVERDIFPSLVKHLSQKEITLLIGARQAGKTTLMKELRRHLIEGRGALENNIYFFNLDIFSDQDVFISQEKFINFLRERTENNNFIYVFIDEAQRIKNAGLFIKGVYDLGLPVKLILSGSSTLELKSQFQESLTGRKQIFYIPTLSWREFLRSKNEGLLKVLALKNHTSEENFLLDKFLKEFLVYGGYPRVAIETAKIRKQEILGEIYSSYIEKDVVGFLKIAEPEYFSNLVKILSTQNGELTNSSNLASEANLNPRSIDKYVYYLEQTFVIRRLKPFFTNAKKELVKMPKIYFNDVGLRNFSLASFSAWEQRSDRGSLLENFVFNELQNQLNAGEKINYWRSKDGAEVDFVLRRNEQIIPIEVKNFMEQFKYSKSYALFMEKYKIKNGYIITLNGNGEKRKYDGTEIEFLNIYNLNAIKT